MKILDIFELAVSLGIESDPRGKEKVEKVLSKRKKDFDELSEKKKNEYDKDKLANPYSDSAIHFGDPEKEVRRVLVGIDIDSAEVLLANELSKKDQKIDLIIAHHPIGKALASLHEVMDIQTEVMAQKGVPENIAEKVLDERLNQVSRSVSPINHYQAVDMAKLLDIPIINIHTPADNSVWKYLNDLIEDRKPETVGEIVDLLKEIPEYKRATRLNAGPMIFSGSEKSRAGKIMVGMTGGTSGSEKIYERMAHYGIGTIVDMHIPEKSREEASKHYINLVIAGHIASDSLGMNLIMDEIEKQGVEIVPCSGFIRVKR